METLTNVRRADLKNGSIEEPNEESGAYAFFDWKGERHRAYFDHFETITKPLVKFKVFWTRQGAGGGYFSGLSEQSPPL
jgi:hypothetical protein